MKKALALVVLIVTPTMAFAQGTVGFANNDFELVKQFMSATDATLVTVPAGAAHVELLTAPNGTAFTPLGTLCSFGFYLNFRSMADFLAANPGWAAIATTAIEGEAGRFDGGTVTLQSTIAGGATAEYVITGWTGSYATLDEAIGAIWPGAFIGCSPLFTNATGNSQSIPPTTAPLLSDTFWGMILGPQPLDGYFGGFTAQPINQTVGVGATAAFYVGANACPPPYYQWYFNGVSIPGATGSSLQITNDQLTKAGTYWVVLSNAAWWPAESGYVSASATLTVLAEPPSITSPPQSQTANVGSTVDFRACATGSVPLAYQWFFNGSPISRAGRTDLQLTSVSPTQAGAYTLVVTNVAGAVTSPPALLSVIPPVELRIVPGLSLLGQAGSLLNLENANTLSLAPAWVILDRVVVTNTRQWYFDVSEPLPPQRFYRAWQTSGPSVIPALSLYMVSAITLTGTIGHSVRLDYINQFGPTDAWVTLTKVTLTDTSQLYFDTSAWHQPPRLYRLVQVP